MSMQVKKRTVIAFIMVIGFILGRLTVRFMLNLLLGGSLFGGNIL